MFAAQASEVSAAAPGSTTVVAPNASASAEGNQLEGVPFGAGFCSSRYQQAYDGSQVGAGTITAITFRPDDGLNIPHGPATFGMTITLSTSPRPVTGQSATFADNVGQDRTVVRSGSVTVSTANTGPVEGPKDFDIVIPLEHAFTYEPAAGPLLLDITVNGCQSGTFRAYFDATSQYPASASSRYSFSAGATTSSPAGRSMVTQFTKIAPGDTTPPVITAENAVTAEATSSGGAVVTYTPTANDAVDGIVPVTCTPASGATFALATTTVTCTASDETGNPAHTTFPVTVTYAWSGVLQPVNADGSSIFRAGSTVPVKFALTGASTGVSTATAKLSYAKTDDGVTGTQMEAVSTAAATSGSLFRYDSPSRQYGFNWSTKGLTAGTYALKIDLGDGATRTVRVSLR